MTELEYSLEQDVVQATDKLNEINEHLKKIWTYIKNLRTQYNSGFLQLKDGLSILDLKNITFLSYLCNRICLISMKLNGEKFENDPAIDRLIELRVYHEKIRALEFKLKNQISKYAKVNDNKGSESSKILTEDFNEIESDSESSDSDDDEYTEKKSGIYKAPKVSQVSYPDEPKDEAQIKKDARERKRYLESDMMVDALNEFTEDPEVIYSTSNGLKRKAQQKIRQIRKYEEDNFTRLALTKKEKTLLDQMCTPSNLASELLNFRSLDAIGHRKESSKRKNTGKFKGSKKRKR